MKRPELGRSEYRVQKIQAGNTGVTFSGVDDVLGFAIALC